MTQDHRYLTLDAMRGIAALIVVLFHQSAVSLAPSGYLAVDFFFLLSGLVIARTYSSRLDSELSALAFMKLRLIRLYPLFAVGLAIGLFRVLSQVAVGHPEKLPLTDIGLGFGLGVFMLPASSANGDLFELNVPAWSLFVELLANAVFAIRAARRPAVVGIMFAVLLVGIGWASAKPGTMDLGSKWAELDIGLLRALFSFTFGAILSKALKAERPRASYWFLLPLLALCSALLFRPGAGIQDLFDFCAITLLFPAIVWFGSQFNPPATAAKAAHMLGEASYPLYVIHFPLVYMARYAARKLGVPPEIWLPLFVPAVFAVSVMLARWYDPKARALLLSIDRRFSSNGSR